MRQVGRSARVLLVMALGACAAAGQAAAPVSVPGVWLALPHDSTHVELVVGDYEGPEPPEISAGVERAIRRAPPGGLACRSASVPVECFFAIPPELGAEILAGLTAQAGKFDAVLPPATINTGDRYVVLLGGGGRIRVTVRAMLAYSGSGGLYLGALAEVAPENLAAYRSSRAPAFLVERAGAASSGQAPLLEPAPKQAVATIQRQLRERLPQRLAGVTPGLRFGFASAEGDRALLAELRTGEGKLRLHVDELQTAAGKTRYFAEAVWGMTGLALMVERCWLERTSGSDFRVLSKSAFPAGSAMQLISAVVLPTGDTGLLVQQQWWESFAYELMVYSDAGLRPTTDEFGGGG